MSIPLENDAAGLNEERRKMQAIPRLGIPRLPLGWKALARAGLSGASSQFREVARCLVPTGPRKRDKRDAGGGAPRYRRIRKV